VYDKISVPHNVVPYNYIFIWTNRNSYKNSINHSINESCIMNRCHSFVLFANTEFKTLLEITVFVAIGKNKQNDDDDEPDDVDF